MDKVLKCPETNKLSKVDDCFKCGWLLQIKPVCVECEVAGKRYFTDTHNMDDLGVIEV